ncbi:MAG: hypothetical protein JW874_07335 [Spirochaetales bacterium]|nr:hypothetical protein [Spirochaetales bacterium]
MEKTALITVVMKNPGTVFSFNDLALLSQSGEFNNLKRQINYYVKKGDLLNLRRGIYAKDNYSQEELSCKIFRPSYLSLEYVLRKNGIIFQYGEEMTIISYLTRNITIAATKISIRKIKNSVLISTTGIIRNDNGINIACSERALLDLLYLNGDCYFDNPGPLDREMIAKLLPVYKSAALEKRVKKILEL